MSLLEPKEMAIPLMGQGEKTFILSKFPAIAGREIITQYPVTAMPKIGDYKTNEELMLKIMAFVGVPREGGEPLRLTTRELVDNHVPDWEALVRLEIAMMDYNCAFFSDGRASAFLASAVSTALPWITSTLTGLSESLSRAAQQPGGSSKRATPSKKRS